jgi:integrase
MPLHVAPNSYTRAAASERALNQAITRLVVALVKEGKARPNLTPHGLRHARGVELAEAGASDAEIMCQLEHTTERTAKIYRKQANRRKMAASGQAKVDNVVQIRARKKALRGAWHSRPFCPLKLTQSDS